jgi:YidC/Oxa1 family membrane protein insertase
MQQKDKMHPEDMRNLIIFGILSVLLWLSYDHFVLKPKMEKMRAAQEIQRQVALTTQSQNGMALELEKPREEIVTQSARVDFKNDLVFGSINLTGARLDDLSLSTYFKTIKKLENSVVLSPAGTAHPKYIEQGWVSADKTTKLPDSKSQWHKIAGDVLSPDSPVTLSWNNRQGLRFEKVISLNKDYGFTVIDRVINNTRQSVTLFPYALVAQRGVPEDFLGRYIVHEGPIGYFGDDLVEKTYGKMKKTPLIEETASKGWVALTSKDWLTAVVPSQGIDTKFRITYTKGATEQIKDRYQADAMGAALNAPVGGMIETQTRFYAGAKKLNLLGQYEKQWNIPHFDLAVDFGIFYFLTRPFFAVINFFYGFVGNFGVAIILFTILLRICVFPLANTSFKSFAKMRKIGPQMSELRTKYKDDKPQLQKELVKLYQKEKVNPMAGCLPILVQIPIFFSLFKVLSNTIEMRHAPFFGWIQDLSAPDPTSFLNLFGALPFDPPSLFMIGAWPCMMLVTMIIQRKLSPPPTDKLQAQMIAMMPWVMTLVLAKFAAGLVIYWTFNNLFSTIQQYIIMSRMGVKVDLLGNILGRKKEPTPIDGIHAEAALVEEQVEDALGIDQDDTPENAVKNISKPKPKKSKKQSKKKK